MSKADESHKELKAKIDELTADLQRVHADFVNYRRRSDEERKQIMNAVKEQVLSELLPILDNLDRVVQHKPPNPAGPNISREVWSWIDGTEMVNQAIQNKIAELGIKKVNPKKGEKFNAGLHEAVDFEVQGNDPAEELLATEVVTEVLSPGYAINDRLIRPARVKVGKQSQGKNKAKEDK